MAFILVDFGRVSSTANGKAGTVWSYKSIDTVATMLAASYFNEIASRLSIGDLMVIRSTTDEISEFFVVTAVSPNVLVGEKFPNSKQENEIGTLITDASTTNKSHYPTLSGGRIESITGVINSGTLDANTTLLFEIGGTFIITDGPMTFNSAEGPGTILSVTAVSENILSQGELEVVKSFSNGATTVATEMMVVFQVLPV